MKHQTLTDIIDEHIANEQRSNGLTTHEIDQVNAAALDGANFFDSLSSVGRQTGTFSGEPIDSSQLFGQLAERFGDPFTELRACQHLAATPGQPSFVHAAAPEKIFCRSCFKTFLLTKSKAMRRYASSTDCDACGEVNKDFHPGTISNGMVTYIVNVCSDCMAIGP